MNYTLNVMGAEGRVGNPFEAIVDQLNRIESMLVELKFQREKEIHHRLVQEMDNGISLAMKITGLKKKSIYNLVNQRMIPHAKKGKRLYFDEQELKDWIKGGKRLTKAEVRRIV